MSQEDIELVRWGLEALERAKEMGAVQYVHEDLIDAGDTIVGVVRASGRGPAQRNQRHGFPAAPQFAFIWTFRNGLVTRQEKFSSKAAALEAAGLREQLRSTALDEKRLALKAVFARSPNPRGGLGDGGRCARGGSREPG